MSFGPEGAETPTFGAFGAFFVGKWKAFYRLKY